ncbi:MAG: hypothetical protein AMK69_17475 [Nitrospira bacterium SG8_3]|nr:MAG: hypothetical protein AMK69_17475 [Nitrospira bacterium SG8_3]
MKTKQWRLSALVLGIVVWITLPLTACEQFEQRDKRFYYRALWNFSLRDNLKELDIDFNGIDFGHSNLYENLLLTGAKNVSAIEDKTRQETLTFIASRPTLPPNEEAIAPTYMKLAWRAQNTFDEAHALHRSTYDIYVSDLSPAEKDRAILNVLAYYQDSPYAITPQRLDHQRLDRFPYSKTFRETFPLFNATIWAYHYLQVAVYDPLSAAPDLPAKQQAVQPILNTYHHYLEHPPVQWTFMPLVAEYSPRFAEQYPAIANIFDNLHMLHDTISDILASDQLPTWDAKRKEIYRVLDSYYLASADATNPMVLHEPQFPHSHH